MVTVPIGIGPGNWLYFPITSKKSGLARWDLTTATACSWVITDPTGRSYPWSSVIVTSPIVVGLNVIIAAPSIGALVTAHEFVTSDCALKGIYQVACTLVLPGNPALPVLPGMQFEVTNIFGAP